MDNFGQPRQQNNEPEPRTDEPGTQFEQKETYVTAEGEPTTVTPVAATAPVKDKKQSNAGKWLLWSFVVLLLAGLSALAYWQFTEAQSAQKEVDSLSTSLQAAQDAHKEQMTATQNEDAPELTDKELIANVVVADAQAPVASKDQKLSVTISKQNTSFALVKAGDSTSGAGYAVILKKVNDEWVIVFKGQNAPDRATIDKYGIPAEYQS